MQANSNLYGVKINFDTVKIDKRLPMADTRSMAGKSGKEPSEGGTEARRYHHGDLRSALVAAAEDELSEKGVEGFTLRGCAKRAGVSHAAPAHHFKDATALLTALAATGFRRFLAMQLAFQADAPKTPREQMLASGLAYIAFASDHPALFRLIFSSDRPDYSDAELLDAADTAFGHMVAGVKALYGEDAPEQKLMLDVAATWAIVHGVADLTNSGKLKSLGALPEKARRQALIAVIERVLPPA
jgi:AcrR family transcriptional regulator